MGALEDALMTHWPEQPNPAKPYTDAAERFAKGGISGVIGHHDPLGDVLQSDAAATALSVMTPIKGTGVRMGAPELGDIKGAANFNTAYSPSRTVKSIETELQEARANIQGYKDAIEATPAEYDTTNLHRSLSFEHEIYERLMKELETQGQSGKILGFPDSDVTGK